jgi:hypothetical protein
MWAEIDAPAPQVERTSHSAGYVPGLKDGHFGPAADKFQRSGETGRSGADDNHTHGILSAARTIPCSAEWQIGPAPEV